MKENRHLIHIFGASGAGTTTLGKAMDEEWNYTHLDIDDYFWLPTEPPFTTPRETALRTALLSSDLENTDKCVLTGSLCGWGDMYIPLFHLVIYLEAPTEIRMQRLKAREEDHFGSRILAGGDMYQIHQDFLVWAKSYDTADLNSRRRALHKQWLEKITCPILTLDGTKTTDILLREIKEATVSQNSNHFYKGGGRQT
jgi:adenylate kinase family enzyme